MREKLLPAAGWLALALSSYLGVAGGAATPGGLLLGVADAKLLIALLVAFGVLVIVAGWRSAVPCIGLAVAPVLVLFGRAVPGVHAMAGPPMLAIALAGVTLILLEKRFQPPGAFLFPVVLLVQVSIAARVQSEVGPRGDEPHYLMVADSLLRDRDLSLERDYAEGRYRAFHPGDLAPHYRVRGKHGEIYSIHAIGLSLLVLPAYAIGGYPGASFFMALLASLLVLELRGLLKAAVGETGEALAWVLALSPPIVHYAGLVFTEIPAACIVAMGLRRAPNVTSGRGGLMLASALAFLPWLNVRYVPLAILLLAFAMAHAARQRLRLVVVLLTPILVSGIALAFYHHALFGFFDPRRVYGRRPELALRILPDGLTGLLLDQEFGLLVYAPVFVLAVVGFSALVRRRPGLAITAVGLVSTALFVSGAWPMWRGGWNPPARFLLPVVPALALGVAGRWAKGLSAAGALLVGWGLWTGAVGGYEPRLVHRDRDEIAPLFRVHSGAEEWTRLLPGLVLAEPDRYRLALIFGVALGLAAISRKRTVAATAVATLGLLAAAGVASRVAERRTGDRDAVRLIGRPAFRLPGWTFLPSATAQWTLEAMGQQPLYEPHRHPDGFVLGRRLPLPPGGYALSIVGDVPGRSADTEIVLEVRAEASEPRRAPLVRATRGWEGRFEARPGEGAVTLLLRGGCPILIRSINLCVDVRSNPVKGVGGEGS